jgi:hypothetical protein
VDPIRFAVLAMGSGVAFGVAVISVVALVVDALKTAAPSPAGAPALGLPLFVVFFGTIAGLVLAGVVTWRLLSPVVSIYRRGGLSVVSGLATVMPMWLCPLVNQLAGRAGLAALGVVALGVSALLARGARREVMLS